MLNYHAVMTYTNDFEKFVKAVDSVQLLWPNMTIIDNSINKCAKLKYPKADIYETPVQFTCSQAFNCSQTIARKHNADILIMMHGDMEVTDEKDLKKFLDFLEFASGRDGNWGVCFTHYDALCAFNMDCCDVIGPWDQNISHYPIDIDYYYRIKKHGFKCLDFGGDWVNHYASSTIRKNIMMDHINLIHTNESNNTYYQRKWGGCRDQEQYEFPFNGQDLNKQYLKMLSDPVYEKLINSFYTEEGSFLYRCSETGRLAQHSLILNILNAVKPKSIIEVGTHKYFFPFFLSNFIDKFRLETFDIRTDCLNIYDIVEKSFKAQGITVNFHCGDSKETLKAFLKENRKTKFDLGWVDGGHDYETVFSDLSSIGRMKASYILVDDSRMESVNQAITDFTYDNDEYCDLHNPYWKYDDRGIAILRRKRNA
jgi:hypothetical protein